ncbi:MAG: helix-turn-helix domain-containing protein [Acidobacteria bacterium]|nr:helix-turn-helix domain-containing protein [Acidobacteriota bacterium]
MQAKNEALLAKINEMRAEVDEVRTMSVEEAAARLGVSTALVRAEIAAGRLSYCPMGRLIRITVKDLREYLDRIRTRRPIPEADQEPE